jgi:hypothetical protein
MSDEEVTFESLLEGDGFLNEEEKAAQAARERRLKRKRRLEVLSKGSENEASVEPSNLEISEQSHKKQTESVSIQSAVDAENIIKIQVEEGREREDEEGQAEFDMFSSSTSPPLSRGMLLTLKQEGGQGVGKVDQQHDWDDAEGYYKATIGKKVKNIQV